MSERVQLPAAAPAKPTRKRRTKAEIAADALRAAEAAGAGTGHAAPPAAVGGAHAPEPIKPATGRGPLLDALKFVAPGSKENGEPYSVHAMIYGGWITTSDGVLTYGAPIPDQLYAMPNFHQLHAAIKSAGENVSITQIDPSRLSITSGRVRVMVPCLADPDLVSRMPCDPPIGPCDNRIREGFKTLAKIASDTAEHVMQASVLMDNHFMYATDRVVMLEVWHGIPFPKLTVPRGFVHAIDKCGKDIVSFGFSDSSLSFHFADGSFIRTQLFSEAWPEFLHVMPTDFTRALPIPAGFFEAIADVKPFTVNDKVAFRENEVATHNEQDVGAVIQCPGVAESEGEFSAKRLLMIAGLASHFDHWSDDKRLTFVGTGIRGVMSSMKAYTAEEKAEYAATRPAPTPPAAPVAPIAGNVPPAAAPAVGGPPEGPASTVPASSFPVGSRVTSYGKHGTVTAHPTTSTVSIHNDDGSLSSCLAQVVSHGPPKVEPARMTGADQASQVMPSAHDPAAGFVPPTPPAPPADVMAGFKTPGGEPAAPPQAVPPVAAPIAPPAVPMPSPPPAGTPTFFMPSDATL